MLAAIKNFKYFNGVVSPGFVALFSGRTIQFVANGLLGLFLPIFLLTKFNYDISLVFLFYLLSNVLYIIVLPWGAKFLNNFGLTRALRISVFFAALYFLCFFFIDYNVASFSLLALFFLTIYRVTFWYPYHVDFAKLTNLQDRGKSVSLFWASDSLLSIIMPLIAGLLIKFFGFKYVFILAIIIFLCSYIPFLTLPRTKERFSWSYRKTYKYFLANNNRKLVIANMANGAENAVALVIWPIFIWQLLDGDFFSVGAISSLIVLAAVALQLMAGKYTDLIDKRKLIKWGSMFYAAGWVIKIFVLTSFQIFIAGTYHSFTKIFKDTPFDALNYELMADQGHYIDEYTVLKEMAVQVGKALVLIFAIVVALNLGINWTFALAALSSLLIMKL